MKNIFAGILLVVFSVGCSKNNDVVLISQATITVLHSTCVKTIVKIDLPANANIGVSWSNNLITNPVLYQQVIKVGDMKNAPSTRLEVSKKYKVKIYAKSTVSPILCDLLDQVNEPSVVYDIEFLP